MGLYLVHTIPSLARMPTTPEVLEQVALCAPTRNIVDSPIVEEDVIATSIQTQQEEEGAASFGTYKFPFPVKDGACANNRRSATFR